MSAARTAPLFLAPLGIVAALAAAPGCIPDPAADFEDFNGRAQVVDAGAKDTGPVGNAFGEPISGDYFAICKTSISPTVTNALRFSVATTYAPPASGGKIKLVFTPLKAKQTVFAAADKRGTAIDLPEATVDANGVGTAKTTASFAIPGEANPISGSEIVADTLEVTAKVRAKEKFCADFATKLVKPYSADVTAECLFLALKEGDAIPTLTNEDVDCP